LLPVNWYGVDETGAYIVATRFSDRCGAPVSIKYHIERWESFDGLPPAPSRKWTYGLYDLTKEEKESLEDFMQGVTGC